MHKHLHLKLKNEAETEKLALAVACLDQVQKGGVQIYFSGNLGAGKTTFIRYLLNHLGHSGAVKSPTYSLIESYKIGTLEVFHLDLYRLSSVDELEYLDYKNCFHEKSLVLIEWPDDFLPALPAFDWHFKFAYPKELELHSGGQQQRQVQIQSRDFDLSFLSSAFEKVSYD